jgi:hypothetical protein
MRSAKMPAVRQCLRRSSRRVASPSLAVVVAWASAACGGSNDTAPGEGTSGTPRTVFLTSTLQSAALGGPAGADSLCNELASGAALAGVVKAWLSTTSGPVVERLSHVEGRYQRTDGVRIANGWDDLLDGTLDGPILLDENANPAASDVWTGTLADGSPWPDDDCAGFTVETPDRHAACGNGTAADASWTDHLRPDCSTLLRVYCFEQ